MRSLILPPKCSNFLIRFINQREIRFSLLDSKRPKGLRLFDFFPNYLGYLFFRFQSIEVPIKFHRVLFLMRKITPSLGLVISYTGFGGFYWKLYHNLYSSPQCNDRDGIIHTTRYSKIVQLFVRRECDWTSACSWSPNVGRAGEQSARQVHR